MLRGVPRIVKHVLSVLAIGLLTFASTRLVAFLKPHSLVKESRRLVDQSGRLFLNVHDVDLPVGRNSLPPTGEDHVILETASANMSFKQVKAETRKRTFTEPRPGPNSISGDVMPCLENFVRKLNLTLSNPEDGPGQFGRPVTWTRDDLTPAERADWDRGYAVAGYNVFVSDRLALRRRVTDLRSELCLNASYPPNLPQASVIIPYHKEALSALMRTVISTLDRAPVQLLKEIILVDDFSESQELLGPLDEFVSYLPKVKVLRNRRREGLMRTRMKGVMAATAPVVVIKDAHTEYMPGWLEPLLSTVAASRTTVAISNVHVMSKDNFRITRISPTRVHTFDFRLMQSVVSLSQDQKAQRKSEIEPVQSPAMLGTEFAIDKEYFLELGGYDPGMEIWGGEEMELSFKTWMCGGSMVVVPCSGVAHLFRQANHRSFQLTIRNYLRVAQVWLDEYKDEVYQRYGSYVDKVDIGDISQRVELRKRLSCKSFDWYLRNVANMVYNPRDVTAQGEIHSVGKPSRCLVSQAGSLSKKENQVIDTRSCRGTGYEEFWTVTRSGYIRKDNRCMDFREQTDMLVVTQCNSLPEDSRWEFTQDGCIKYKKSGKCLTLLQNGRQIAMEDCRQGEALQQWTVVKRKGAPSKAETDFP